MRSRISPYLQLMRLNRPIGILLLLWPTLWALWLAAKGFPPLKIQLIFIAGTVLMRSAGCIINDYADRHLDGHVQRTKNRPLVTGAAQSQVALLLFVGLCLLSFVLVLFLNLFAIFLALIGVVLAYCYPFTKRFFQIPQLVLGLAFAWGIPMAFSAVLNHIPAAAWLLFFATFCWIVAYDTQYAMSDKEDDLKVGVKSSALFFGRFDILMVVIFQLMTLLSLVLLGGLWKLSWAYYFSLLVAASLFAYQFSLIHRRNRERCLHAFLNNNWVGVVIFLGFLVN